MIHELDKYGSIKYINSTGCDRKEHQSSGK